MVVGFGSGFRQPLTRARTVDGRAWPSLLSIVPLLSRFIQREVQPDLDQYGYLLLDRRSGLVGVRASVGACRFARRRGRV